MAKSKPSTTPTTRGRQPRSTKPAPQAKQTKKQVALSRRQARQNRIVWIALAALGVLIISILAVGLIREVWLKPTTAVATVDGDKITLAEYEATLNYQRYGLHRGIDELQFYLQSLDPSQSGNETLIGLYQGQITQYEQQLAIASTTALDQLIEDRLIAEKARELGVSVSNDDVDQFLDEQIRYLVAPAAQEPITNTATSPTATPIPKKDLEDTYRNFLAAQQLSDKDYRGIVKRGLLRSGVQEALAALVPSTGLVLQVDMIQSATEEDAVSARDRIEGGEDFAGVAREVSTDSLAQENGGSLGSVAPGQYISRYGQPWDDAVLSAALGELVIVESNGKFYVVRTTNRDDNGTLPEQVLTQRRSSALADWLADRLADPSVVITRDLEPGMIPADSF